MSRRDVIKLGATAALAAMTSCIACATGEGDHSHAVQSVLPPVPEPLPESAEHLSFGEPKTLRYSQVIDLTHTLHNGFPYIPVPGLTFPFTQTPIATIEKNGVFANKWETIDHIGTHIDATNHFNPLGYDLNHLPLQTLIVPVAVIDIKERAAKNYDAALTIDDVVTWEKRNGKLPKGAAVFMNSGWDDKVNDVHAFLNLDATNTLHFPGFANDTAEFLLAERDISGIGVDTISFDVGVDKTYTAHKTLLKGGKWGIENIKNLGRIPPTGATVFIGATKVHGASGGPARLLALW